MRYYHPQPEHPSKYKTLLQLWKSWKSCEKIVAWSCLDLNSWTPRFVFRLSNDNIMLNLYTTSQCCNNCNQLTTLSQCQYTSDFDLHCHFTLPWHCQDVVLDIVYRFNITLSFDGPATNMGVHGFMSRLWSVKHQHQYPCCLPHCLPQLCSGDIEMRCFRPSFCLSRLLSGLLLSNHYSVKVHIWYVTSSWHGNVHFADLTFDFDPVTFGAKFLSVQYLRNYK